MRKANLYFPLWKEYLPQIYEEMKSAIGGMKEISMSKAQFEAYGNRPVSNYVFNLEIQNGELVNDISHTAVARDLFIILNEEKGCKDLFKNNHFKLSLGKEFILRIYHSNTNEQ